MEVAVAVPVPVPFLDDCHDLRVCSYVCSTESGDLLAKIRGFTSGSGLESGLGTWGSTLTLIRRDSGRLESGGSWGSWGSWKLEVGSWELGILAGDPVLAVA